MKKWIFLFALYAAGQHTAVFGQVADSLQRKAWVAIAQPGSTPRWLKLRDDVELTPRNFFEKSRIALGLNARDEFQALQAETDEIGMTHHRFQQFYRGYRVDGAMYTLHASADGRIVTANGRLVTGVTLTEPPVMLSEKIALELVLKSASGKNYLWLDKKAEADLQQRADNPDATFFPVGEMLWLQTDGDAYRLAWKFDIHTTDGQSERIFLDAATGTVLRRVPLDIHCDPGSGTTTWNGAANFNTRQSGGNFILHDDCQAPNIHVFNGQDSSSLAFAVEYTDADNNWNAAGQRSAVQTFFGLLQSWQYFQNRHGRNSYNNAGANINAYNQAGFVSGGATNWSNASWSPGAQVLRFGDHGTDNNANDDWNTVDIVGHEFAHAVTSFSANLTYAGESGALNESFSDIFGEMVELFATGTNDWLMGNDRGAIRSMRNPNAFNDPDTYLGTNWRMITPPCDGTNDQCGVHTNSGVQNFWFFLLSDGGSGVNDNGDTYAVQGIGSAAAARIAYRSLTQYLGSGSDYADAKQGAIQAAIDLFGNCSNEVLQCARAWNAVGVYAGDGLGYDIEVDCPVLDVAHVLGLPYMLDVFNDIRSDCDISPSNGAPVVFEAGHAVLLKPGFTSGDNFHAFIDPCASAIVAPIVGGSENRDPSAGPTGNFAENGAAPVVFPNPFRSKVRIQFELEQEGSVSLRLLDTYGQEVYRWYENETLPAGEHTVLYTRTGLPNGMYTVEMYSGGKHASKQLVKVGD
jgi:Zn-dependent metalloprotease